MRLFVKLYKDTANEEGLPGEWPAQVREIHDPEEQIFAPWLEMTREEYDSYRDLHWPKYQAWEDARKAVDEAQEAAKEAAKAAKKQAVLDRIGLSIEDLKTLGL